MALAATDGSADDKALDIGVPIHNLRDVEETAKVLFKLVDSNNDGQISQKEATDAGNLLVGGFFFRADTNGDGVLTADEARHARESLFAQQPLVRFIIDRAKSTDTAESNSSQPGQASNRVARTAKYLSTNPAGAIGRLLDSNGDKKLEATELRQGVQSAVQAAFRRG